MCVRVMLACVPVSGHHRCMPMCACGHDAWSACMRVFLYTNKKQVALMCSRKRVGSVGCLVRTWPLCFVFESALKQIFILLFITFLQLLTGGTCVGWRVGRST